MAAVEVTDSDVAAALADVPGDESDLLSEDHPTTIAEGPEPHAASLRWRRGRW